MEVFMRTILFILSIISIIFISNCGWYEEVEEAIFGESSSSEDSTDEDEDEDGEDEKEKIVEKTTETILDSLDEYNKCMSGKTLYLEQQKCLENYEDKIESTLSEVIETLLQKIEE